MKSDAQSTLSPPTARDVTRLIHALFRGLDEKDDERVAALFGEAGTWNRQGSLLTGAAEVLDTLKSRAADRETIHLVTNLLIEGSDDRPVARYYLTAYVGLGGRPPSFAAILDCRDEFVRDGSGLTIAAKVSRKIL